MMMMQKEEEEKEECVDLAVSLASAMCQLAGADVCYEDMKARRSDM